MGFKKPYPERKPDGLTTLRESDIPKDENEFRVRIYRRKPKMLRRGQIDWNYLMLVLAVVLQYASSFFVASCVAAQLVARQRHVPLALVPSIVGWTIAFVAATIMIFYIAYRKPACTLTLIALALGGVTLGIVNAVMLSVYLPTK